MQPLEDAALATGVPHWSARPGNSTMGVQDRLYARWVPP